MLGDERGMTLVELIVAMSILAIAMVILLSALTTIQGATVREDVRSRTVDQSRLAMQTVDRQVRSGNPLYPPSGSGYVDSWRRLLSGTRDVTPERRYPNGSAVGGRSECTTAR